jgi:predicted RNA-binding protein
MKKIIILLAALLTISSCKGPKSGPLVMESFDKKDATQVMAGQKSSGPVKTEKINEIIEPCEGCIKLSDLFSGKKTYEGKVIKITGKVTKFNAGIMGKNWIHIQDGSEFEGEYDLTVTTAGEAVVGDTITIEGKITLDKDFGYGYFYNVLMEEGKPVL